MSHPDNLYLCENPLIANYLTMMRDKNCPGAQFRTLMNQITTFLMYEAMEKTPLPVSSVKIQTPADCNYEVYFIDSSSCALVALMRSGMTMATTAHSLLPRAVIGHAGYRKELEKLVPFFRSIPNLSEKLCFVFDSGMITGESMRLLLDYIISEKSADISKIVIVTIIASEPGMKCLNEFFPDNNVKVFAAAYDHEIYSTGKISYTKPGVGSFQERMFGCAPDTLE